MDLTNPEWWKELATNKTMFIDEYANHIIGNLIGYRNSSWKKQDMDMLIAALAAWKDLPAPESKEFCV